MQVGAKDAARYSQRNSGLPRNRSTPLNPRAAGPILTRMSPPLTASQTVDRARALLESGKGAALPELLKLIETLSIDICKVTIGELAELIEKDGVVLAKVISVANKLAHNPGISPIATVSQAIHQLGYNRIRTVAVSLMLLDNAGASNPQEQRDAAALALSAGLIAQGAAEFTGTHDPELAFACAALRNLGRILMAAISPEHYREALELAHQEPAVDGFRRRFGLTALELSRKVLAGSRLPEEVTKTLRDCEPETLNGVASTHEGRLLAIADYGSRLATLTLDEREPDDGFVRRVTQLNRRFQRLIPRSEDVATPALLRANEKLRSFTRCCGVTGLPTASLQRIRQRLEIVAPDAVLDAEKREVLPVGLTASGLAEALAAAEAEAAAMKAAAAAPMEAAESAESTTAAAGAEVGRGLPTPPLATPDSTEAATPAAAEVEAGSGDPALQPDRSDSVPAQKPPAPAVAPALPAPSPDLARAAPPAAPPASSAPTTAAAWDTALNELTAFGAQAAEHGPADACTTALMLSRDAVKAQECWLFRRPAGGTALAIAAGIGPQWQRFRARAAVRAGERSVFGLCLTRREVVLIHDTGDATLRNYLPAWWHEVGDGPKAFTLIPVSIGNEARGLLLVGWPDSRKVKLTQGQVALINQLFAPMLEAPSKAA